MNEISIAFYPQWLDMDRVPCSLILRMKLQDLLEAGWDEIVNEISIAFYTQWLDMDSVPCSLILSEVARLVRRRPMLKQCSVTVN